MSDESPHVGPVRTEKGAGGLPLVRLEAADGACAEIHAHGAHVASWRPAGGDERLFLSATSEFRDGVAIRGGVPVIFPQFAARGPLPKHGFARTAAWTVMDVRADGGGATATLALRDSAATRAIWPHAFAAELAVTVGGPSLRIALTVTNTGDAAFDFTAALHTYLRVRDVHAATIAGLAGTRYEDTAAGGGTRVQTDDVLHVAGEVDRVYLDAPSALVVREPDRTTIVASSGFPDVVVWNPGAVRAVALPDLEPDGWRRMLCVEAAAVGTPVPLSPGARWTASQTLTAR